MAFGHSFLLYGDVEMPMATADVVATIASDQYSYKMARPVAMPRRSGNHLISVDTGEI